MARMIVDPEEVLRFAGLLAAESEHIHQRTIAVTAEISGLGDYWRDSKYSRFEGVYQQTTAQLEHFLDRAHDYANHLRHKADIVFEYTEHRY